MEQVSCGHRHALGITRRELVQVGYSGLLGLGLPSLLARQAEAAARRPPGATLRATADSVIFIFLTGAPSHIDTFDMKPQAPAEIRGSFQPIATRAPGVQICEHLPLLAARADRFAIVRSMTHGLPSHEHGTHFLLTGIDKNPPGASHMASRADWPCYASGIDYVRPRTDGIPSGVMLPTYLNNGYGFCGQNAGLLGAKFDPWQIRQNPNDANFRVESLNLPIGLTATRLGERQTLLAEVDDQRARLDALAGRDGFHSLQQKAFAMLSSSRIARAFALEREDPRLRDRYGRHLFGQSLLLARRLVEAGVPVVQANMGHMNQWDTHTKNCASLKGSLLPPLDRGVSTLLDDLHARGLLERTLVVMVGEFGRTPRLGRDNGGNITAADGRDHWAGVFFAVFAGAGVRGGQAIGRSDKTGAYPASRAFYPSDLGATIYSSLGVDPATEVRDMLGRPFPLCRGQRIEPLFDGAAV